MINRLVSEESDSVSRSSTEVESLSEPVNKLDFESGNSAISTVFGSTGSESGSKRSSSKSPARERRGSGTALRTASPTGGFLSIRRPRKHKQATADKREESQKHDDHLARWLSSGNVIYKSVGLGLMDLIVGLEVVKLAQTKGKGALVDNFSA